jgi:hypothetical protein
MAIVKIWFRYLYKVIIKILQAMNSRYNKTTSKALQCGSPGTSYLRQFLHVDVVVKRSATDPHFFTNGIDA